MSSVNVIQLNHIEIQSRHRMNVNVRYKVGLRHSTNIWQVLIAPFCILSSSRPSNCLGAVLAICKGKLALCVRQEVAGFCEIVEKEFGKS